MDRSGWSEYLKKQRLQDLKALAKQLGIYIKSNTKKGDCIEIILNKALDILIRSYNFSENSKEAFFSKQQHNSTSLQLNQLNNNDESTNLKTVEISEYSYSILKNNSNSVCSMCHQVLSENDVTCDVCSRQFHHRCIGYDDEKTELNKNQLMVFLESISKREQRGNINVNSIKFVCPFCRFFILDPYNKIIKPLFFTTVYSYTAIHNIHPKYGNISFSNSSHLPQFTSKFTFSPNTIFGENYSSKQDLKDGRLMIYCLRLDRMDLNHEYPRLLCVKANNKIVQNIESPSYDHIRRDCPIDLSDFISLNQLITKPSINITFNTVNALVCENSPNTSPLPIPTAPFIIGLFHTKSISCDKIIDWLISEKSLSFDISKTNFKNIIENKAHFSINDNMKQEEDSSDEIICLNEDQSLNTLCPLTMDIIELPGRGSYCHHINCFDIKAFIQINSTIKAFNTRWKCPICYQIIRPSMLIIDNFVKKLIMDDRIPKENNKIMINIHILDKIDLTENNSDQLTKGTPKSQGSNFQKINLNNSFKENRDFFSESEILQNSNQSVTTFNVARSKDKVEIINISDDEDENTIIEDNFIINEEELNLILTKTINENKIIEDPCSEYILKTLALQNSDKRETIFSDIRKKRRVSVTSPSSNSSNPSIISPNYDKTSLSLKL